MMVPNSTVGKTAAFSSQDCAPAAHGDGAPRFDSTSEGADATANDSISAAASALKRDRMNGEIVFPEFYKGIFERTRAAYGPLISDAIGRIKALDVSAELRPSLAFQTWDNPQPSFILLPFMYLATAEASGAIGQRHRDHLPAILLMAEYCAVADDTIDRAPTRSGRLTFAAKFGDPSAVPFACALANLVLAQSHQDQRLFEEALRFFMVFHGLELWERENTYPPPAMFKTWLEHRYLQATIANEYALNCAVVINDQPRWPRPAVEKLAVVGQDVDDIVNIAEYRAGSDENDDLQSGVVTRPLIFAVEEVPSLAGDVIDFWDHYRSLGALELSIPELQRRRAAVFQNTLPLYKHIRSVILDRGVPRSIRQCLADFRSAVRESPPPWRPTMHDLTSSFIDRLRRCHYVDVPV
jgi:Polyprenyl synthetase